MKTLDVEIIGSANANFYVKTNYYSYEIHYEYSLTGDTENKTNEVPYSGARLY